MSTYVVKAHLIDAATGAILARPLMRAVPRVGDEIRLSGERYFKATLVVWCLDEHEAPLDRVNIGVEPVAP